MTSAKTFMIGISLLMCVFSLYAEDCNKVMEKFEVSFIEEIGMEELTKLEACTDNKYALDYLGSAYAQEGGAHYDKAKAFKYLSESAQLGGISAKIDLAESYILGSITEVNFDKAKSLAEDILKSKNTNNQLFARYVLAFIEAERNTSGDKVEQQIQSDLFSAGKAGYKGASNLLLKLDEEKRLNPGYSNRDLLSMAARNGNMDAKFKLALVLLKEKNTNGLSYIFELAHAGYLDAQIYLVKYFRHKNQRDSMLYWMKTVAKNGHPELNNNYGAEILQSNAGQMRLTEQDDAIKYFTFAANHGVKEAFNNIGHHYKLFFCQTQDDYFYKKTIENYVKGTLNGKSKLSKIEMCEGK